MGKQKLSRGKLSTLQLSIRRSRKRDPEWAARMDEILGAVTGKQGQLILLIGTEVEVIEPPGGFSSGKFNVETCFGLGILSSGDPADVGISEVGKLMFPTNKQSCVVYTREDRMRVAHENLRSALLPDELSTGFNDYILLRLTQINQTVDYQGPSRRLLEVFCGTSTVEALFEPRALWAWYREQFEYMCKVLGHETTFTRKAREEAHAKAIRTLNGRRGEIGSEIRAVYLEAQKLGVADTPDYRALRNVLEQLGLDWGLS